MVQNIPELPPCGIPRDLAAGHICPPRCKNFNYSRNRVMERILQGQDPWQITQDDRIREVDLTPDCENVRRRQQRP